MRPGTSLTPPPCRARQRPPAAVATRHSASWALRPTAWVLLGVVETPSCFINYSNYSDHGGSWPWLQLYDSMGGNNVTINSKIGQLGTRGQQLVVT